jgi:hypothetical protein
MEITTAYYDKTLDTVSFSREFYDWLQDETPEYFASIVDAYEWEVRKDRIMIKGLPKDLIADIFHMAISYTNPKPQN